jgi:hypothetical protein
MRGWSTHAHLLTAVYFTSADKGQLEADLLAPGQSDFAGIKPGLMVSSHATIVS